jgi:hypothetical protein
MKMEDIPDAGNSSSSNSNPPSPPGKLQPGLLAKMGSAFRRIFSGGSTPEAEEEVKFEISKPVGFRHVTKVKADPHSSTGFTVSTSFVF